ncbi:MAG: SIR2 family protein [Deferribacterales bacterium]
MKDNFPAQIQVYLNEIAQRLFNGHAAIMVGSGFSRNASGSYVGARTFPDWSQLGDLFYEKIRVPTRNVKEKKYLNILKLAEEVQATFGRAVLEQMIIESVPDIDYSPSELHKKLLELPWVDIFTTNYDTLLERTAQTIVQRNYTPVVDINGLIYAEQPRIIKLHGSFPDARPFIITEEDYRKYPKEFAPFVNTVQQSLIENTFCLIGFSGDDPNFLQWIGWIRDNLGESNSSKIYLVGIFNFSDTEKRLLEKRNIMAVDMSVCCEDSQSHYEALDKFVEYMEFERKSRDLLDWPKKNKDSLTSDRILNNEELEKYTACWKEQRLSYPGWIIVPEGIRNNLFRATHYKRKQSSFENITFFKYAYELVWRLEKSLCPLESELVNFLHSFILEFFLKIESCDGKLTVDEEDIYQMACDLLLSLLRFYREEGLFEEWEIIKSQIEKILIKQTSEYKARYKYELVLDSLFRLDLNELVNRLKNWTVDSSLPFWQAKRACILAEIGLVSEAVEIIENALINIRLHNNKNKNLSRFSLLSQESYVMFLLERIRFASLVFEFSADEYEKENSIIEERYHALKQFKCEPDLEFKFLSTKLNHQYTEKKEITVKEGFDLGSYSRSGTMYGYYDEDKLIAYNFLKFCEDVGLPFRVGHCVFATSEAQHTLERINRDSPYWAVVTLIRIEEMKAVELIFNRESISAMKREFIDGYVDNYLSILKQVQEDVYFDNFNINSNNGSRLALIPEILSRLCCKCSEDKKDKLLDVLAELYKFPKQINDDGVRHLAERLISSYSVSKQFEIIPRLLEFPVPVFTYQEHILSLNPLNMLRLDISEIENLERPYIEENIIYGLIKRVSVEKDYRRSWYIYTLMTLFDLKLLNAQQVNAFSNAVWSQTDNTGFPSFHNYYKFVFLEFPHPENVDPTPLFIEYIKKKDFPLESGSGYSGYLGNIPVCFELMSVREDFPWSYEDTLMVFNRLVKWWDHDKDRLKNENKPVAIFDMKNEFLSRFNRLSEVLIHFIAPRFEMINTNKTKADLVRIIKEFKEYGVPDLHLMSAFLHIFPETKPRYVKNAVLNLTSGSEANIVNALSGILYVLRKHSDLLEKEEINQLCMVIAQMALWKTAIAMNSVLSSLRAIIREMLYEYGNNFEEVILLVLDNLANIQEDETAYWSFSEKLHIRQAAAGLSFELYKYYLRNDKPIPEVIRIWESICASDDEFDDIRNEWII